MIEFFYIILIFVFNSLLTLTIRKMKNNLGAGVDLVLIGALLAGHWFGWRWGIIVGMLLRLSIYIITMEYDTGMIYAIPVAGIPGLIGAIVTFFSIPLFTGVVIAVFTYLAVYYSIRLFIFGDTNYVMMTIEAFGLIVVNIVIFRFFI